MYKASEDYPRLKELLDKGERIICYIDFQFGNKEWKFLDIAEAYKIIREYNIGVRGHIYCSVDPDWFDDYTDERMFELWKNLNVQFIDPDPDRNNVELKTK